MTATVERSEMLTTPAGTFNTFVIRWQQRQVPKGHDFEYEYWYAPALGFNVKQAVRSFTPYKVNAPSWQLVSIQRPPVQKSVAR
jgi:hypothetical protein